MTATAVGTLVKGLTATQALDVAAAAVQLAAESGIDVGTMTISAPANWHAAIMFQPEDDVARDLAALLGLTEYTPVESTTPDLARIQGDWFGARLTVLATMPVEAV